MKIWFIAQLSYSFFTFFLSEVNLQDFCVNFEKVFFRDDNLNTNQPFFLGSSITLCKFWGYLQCKKICSYKWHEIFIGTIRQVQNPKKFKIPMIEVWVYPGYENICSVLLSDIDATDLVFKVWNKTDSTNLHQND